MIRDYFKRRKARKAEEKRLLEERRKEIGIFREYFELISEVLIYVFFVMTFLLQSFVIPTQSMVDTILIGDHLLVNKVAYSRSLGPLDSLILPQQRIDRNMIVTFKSPPEMKKEYVKRVIGLPGDLVRIENQKIFINGKPFDDRFQKYRAEYPTDETNTPLTDRYKERTRYLVIGGKYIKEHYKWYRDGATELSRVIFDLEENRMQEELYRYALTEKEVIYDLDKLATVRKELVSSGQYEISDVNVGGDFSYQWIRDNFPLDIKDYELRQEFNERRDYTEYLVRKDGKTHFKVPQGHYFCIGDNRDHSWDSRYWGPVPEEYIIGKPWRIYWSYDANDYLETGLGNKIKGLINTVLNFFSKTRWDRTGKLVQ